MSDDQTTTDQTTTDQTTTDQTTQEPASILSAADKAPPSTEPQEPVRPEGLEDTFWDAENNTVKVDVLAKSYSELRKKLNQKFEVPESYDLGEDTGFEVGDETLSSFKEMGLTNDQAKSVVSMIRDKFLPAIEQREVSLELAELRNHWRSADDGAFYSRLKSVKDFVVEKLGSEEMADAAIRTKDAVVMWENMLKAEMAKGRVETSHPASRTMITINELEQKMQDPRYNPSNQAYDQAYRNEVDALWEAYARQAR